jgi:hypothetical protein
MLHSSLCWYSCFLAQSDTQYSEHEATDHVASQTVTGVEHMDGAARTAVKDNFYTFSRIKLIQTYRLPTTYITLESLK